MSRWRRRLAVPAILTVTVLVPACGDRVPPPDAPDPTLAITDAVPTDDAIRSTPDAAPPIDAPPDAIG